MANPPPAAGGERRAVPVLRVGHVPGVTVTKWRRAWAERFPRLGLEVVEVVETEQLAALDQERVDMCFIRQAPEDSPVDAARMHVIPLYEEVAVVVVPRDHPASLFEEVTLADLDDEQVLDGLTAAEAIDLVAGGAGVVVLPHAIARSFSRRDLVYRPVSDAPPTRVALAWLRENPHEMIEEFIGIVRGRTVNSSRGTPSAPPPPPDTARTGGRARRPTGRRPTGRRPGRGR